MAYGPLQKAVLQLSKQDNEINEIIVNYGLPNDKMSKGGFETLLRKIVGQQISVKAAQAVWDKFEKKTKKVTPQNVLKLHYMSIKSCGLSRQKITYLKALSNAFISREINPKNWNDLSDEQVINE